MGSAIIHTRQAYDTVPREKRFPIRGDDALRQPSMAATGVHGRVELTNGAKGLAVQENEWSRASLSHISNEI